MSLDGNLFSANSPHIYLTGLSVLLLLLLFPAAAPAAAPPTIAAVVISSSFKGTSGDGRGLAEGRGGVV